MHDLVIRGGHVIDGTGAPERVSDVAIDGERIVDVGNVSAKGKREIDARGYLVTPGWVDIHTHYDGQATWDPLLAPSPPNGEKISPARIPSASCFAADDPGGKNSTSSTVR